VCVWPGLFCVLFCSGWSGYCSGANYAGYVHPVRFHFLFSDILNRFT